MTVLGSYLSHRESIERDDSSLLYDCEAVVSAKFEMFTTVPPQFHNPLTILWPNIHMLIFFTDFHELRMS